MLYAHQGSSLFAYCVGELGYDGAGAQLRISAMRLLKDLPELEGQVENGEFNLSLLAQAQTFFKKENIQDLAAKKEFVATIAGKTTREAQRELLDRAQSPEVHRPEKVRAVSRTHSELRFLVDEEFLADLETLRNLLAHVHPLCAGNGSFYPRGYGGASTVTNLRLRCRIHNQLAAVDAFGHAKMKEFIPSLRE